jgi:protocatechuate 4,5-dioxygenase beta chain
MAQLIGGLGTSHIPAIGGAIHKGLQQDPYWKPFFDGFPPITQWLGEVKPDVVVMFYNDHGLNFFLDKMPTFAVGAARSTATRTKAGAFPRAAVPGRPELSWHLINTLVDKEFDVVTCQEMLVDHACTLPLKLFWPEGDWPGDRGAGLHQHGAVPAAQGQRAACAGPGRGPAIRSWGSDERVVVLGTGGLSHQLDGERAGSSTSPSTCSSWTAWKPTPSGPRSSAITTWCERPARRAWSC